MYAPALLSPKRRRLGRHLLATAGAARGQNPAAADGGLAGAEAVTALAHEAARLIGALHRGIPKISSIALMKKGRQTKAAANGGADKRESAQSQSPSRASSRAPSRVSVASRVRRRVALARPMTRSARKRGVEDKGV